jgi:hypothetical protein
VKPVLQALVLAERVYTDITGKKIIAGTFNRVLFKHNVPFVQEAVTPDGIVRQAVPGGLHSGSPCLYMSLTDVADKTEISIQFLSLKRNEVFFEANLPLACDDHLKTIEIVAPLPPLRFPEAGTYAFEVVCEGEIIGSHRIVAEEMP